MSLALFDLDNTLLIGDSDYLWGCFLVEKGLVDKQLYEEANERFYQQYVEGELDIHEFLRFALTPLADNDPNLLHSMHEEFMQKHIRPIMSKTGMEKIAHHQAQGDGLHQGRESEAYRSATHLVEMNHEDMSLLGISEGDIVSVSTSDGRTAVPVAAGDLPRGMIFMPMGPAANLLIGGATASTGMPSYKGQIAEVEAV